MVLARIDSDGYKIVLLLHILSVVVGIGAVCLNSLYGLQAKSRKGREGLAVAQANFRVSMIAEKVIYTIPLFGIGLVFMSDDVFTFEQTWIWLAIVLYVVAIGISHGVITPTAKKMIGLMEELAAGRPPAAGGPPPQAAELDALGKKVGAADAAVNLVAFVIIVLMVWKPGL